MDRHTHRAFDADLEALRSAVLAMGGMVEAQISRAQDVLAGGESVILDRVRAGERSLLPMTAMARRLRGNSLNALARLDLVLAGSVIDDDESLDTACRALPNVLLQHEHDRSMALAIALDTVLLGRSIERMGDHAKNIAEGVFYIVRGKDLRHSKPADVPRVIGE